MGLYELMTRFLNDLMGVYIYLHCSSSRLDVGAKWENHHFRRWMLQPFAGSDRSAGEECEMM